ncbi:MAG: hypothetical protein JSV79_00850 [Armatimonadota bacterium]|nr:MAG: hypothetical protein JSV79_00850 [Armatimonadota bacterium]
MRVALLLGLCLCTASCCVPGVAVASPDEPFASEIQYTGELLASLQGYGDQMQSGKLRLRTEAEFLEQKSDNFIEELDVWFDGVRSRVEQRVVRSFSADEPSATTEVCRVFDGERVVETTPPELGYVHVAVVQDLPDLPSYTGLGNAGPLYLYAIGPSFNRSTSVKADIARSGGQVVSREEVSGLVCWHMSAPEVAGRGWQLTRSWWIGPSADRAVVQYSELITWTEGPTQQKETLHTVSEWLESAPDVWLPKVVTRRVLIQPRGGQEKLARVDTTKLLAAAANIAIEDTVFELELPEGTTERPFR